MRRARQRITTALTTIALAGQPLVASADSVIATEGEMVVTLLGTGTPAPLLDRFGYATLVSAGEQVLLFDVCSGFGRWVFCRARWMRCFSPITIPTT